MRLHTCCPRSITIDLDIVEIDKLCLGIELESQHWHNSQLLLLLLLQHGLPEAASIWLALPRRRTGRAAAACSGGQCRGRGRSRRGRGRGRARCGRPSRCRCSAWRTACRRCTPRRTASPTAAVSKPQPAQPLPSHDCAGFVAPFQLADGFHKHCQGDNVMLPTLRERSSTYGLLRCLHQGRTKQPV